MSGKENLTPNIKLPKCTSFGTPRKQLMESSIIIPMSPCSPQRQSTKFGTVTSSSINPSSPQRSKLSIISTPSTPAPTPATPLRESSKFINATPTPTPAPTPASTPAPAPSTPAPTPSSTATPLRESSKFNFAPITPNFFTTPKKFATVSAATMSPSSPQRSKLSNVLQPSTPSSSLLVPTKKEELQKSPSRTPVSAKIHFYEQTNVATPTPQEDASSFPEIKRKIEFYEKLYIPLTGSMSRGTSKRDIVMKSEDWKKMMTELLGQVQGKENELKGIEIKLAQVQEQARRAEDKADKYKSEKNTQLKESMAKTSGHKEENESRIAELEKQNKQLLDEKQLREVQISLLKAEVQSLEEYDGENHKREEDLEHMRTELEKEKEKSLGLEEEVERLSKKLASRNAELKLYKSKVEHFLELLESRATPTKKRPSNGEFPTSENKKARSISSIRYEPKQ